MFWLSQPPGKASNHFRGQLVNPNFAESIEFSTKFSETPLRKLILLTKRLSVEIDNLLLFICKEWRWIQLSTNILEERSFLPEISNQKLQIRVYTVPFQTLSLILQNVQKNKKLKQNSFQVTTDAFQASIGKHASCRNRKKRTKSAKISFRWQIFDHLVTMMTNLHRFLWCWRCCPFASSVIWEDRLDALSARRATIADVTSTNWTKKGDFRRNYPLFDNCYCHIDTSEIQISGSSSVFSWHCRPPVYCPVCGFIFIVIVFHSLFANHCPLCRCIYISFCRVYTCLSTWQEFLHIPIGIFVFISRELLAEDCLPPFSHWNLTSFMSISVSRPPCADPVSHVWSFSLKSECIYRCFDYSINYWPINWIVNIPCVQFQQLHIKYIFVMEKSLLLSFLTEIKSHSIFECNYNISKVPALQITWLSLLWLPST